MISSWIFDVFIIKKTISAVFLFIPRRCGPHMAFSYEYSSNMYRNRPFHSHISVHYATSLHCVECTKQVLFDHATSIRFVDQTFPATSFLPNFLLFVITSNTLSHPHSRISPFFRQEFFVTSSSDVTRRCSACKSQPVKRLPLFAFASIKQNGSYRMFSVF